MIARHQVLAAVLDPLDRASDEARRERNQKILRIELAACAKAAAHVVFHHADRRFGQSHHLGKHAPVGERDLGDAGNDEPSVRRVPFGEKAARLHRHRRVPLHTEPLAADIRCLSKSLLDVAANGGDGGRDIGPGWFEQEDVVLARRVAVDNGGERFDVEVDCLQCILGQGRRFRHDHGNRLADIAYLVVRDHRLLVAYEGRQRLLTHRNGRNLRIEIGRRDDGKHSRLRARRGRVDRPDASVRHRAT